MRKVTWNACFKRNCDGRISASLKVKYKKTICKVVAPDIDRMTEDDFDEQFINTLKTAFGKKKGKKIADQVFNELSEI